MLMAFILVTPISYSQLETSYIGGGSPTSYGNLPYSSSYNPYSNSYGSYNDYDLWGDSYYGEEEDLGEAIVVNVVDIQLVAGKWNSVVGDPKYDPKYDVNSDGKINIVDIQLVAGKWNTKCP